MSTPKTDPLRPATRRAVEELLAVAKPRADLLRAKRSLTADHKAHVRALEQKRLELEDAEVKARLGEGPQEEADRLRSELRDLEGKGAGYDGAVVQFRNRLRKLDDALVPLQEKLAKALLDEGRQIQAALLGEFGRRKGALFDTLDSDLAGVSTAHSGEPIGRYLARSLPIFEGLSGGLTRADRYARPSQTQLVGGVPLPTDHPDAVAARREAAEAAPAPPEPKGDEGRVARPFERRA